MIPTRTKVVGAIILVAAGYTLGRYAQPAKVITETKTVYVDKKTDDSEAERNKHKTTIVHEVTKPDGSKETTSTTTESTETHKERRSTDESSTETASRTETTYKDTVNISLLAGAGSFTGPIIYGGAVTKRIIGPITAGAWGLTNATFGLSIGLSL